MAARWTAEQLEYLEKNYHNNDLPDLVKNIGKTKDAIQWKASSLGLLLRDGRDHGPIKKITIGINEKYLNYLKKNKHNQSGIIREALELYFAQHNIEP
jgi:hypothetical protein